MNTFVFNTVRQAKRLIIAIIGSTVLCIGIAMIVLPGPGIPIVIIGLAILASEFIWARILLKKVKTRFQKNKKGGNVNEAK